MASEPTATHSTMRLMPERTHIVIADGDPVARRVIRDALGEADGVVVVAQASDGVEAVELASYYRPQLLVCEMTMPRLGGMEVLRRVRADAPEVGVVFLSSTDSPALQMRALLAGARGFISKERPLDKVVQTLARLRPDEAVVSTGVTAELVRALCALPKAGTGVRPIRSPLTQREWEILDLLSAGHSEQQIAAKLGVVGDTVRSHLKHARAKLRVARDGDVVHAANRQVQTRGRPGASPGRGKARRGEYGSGPQRAAPPHAPG